MSTIVCFRGDVEGYTRHVVRCPSCRKRTRHVFELHEHAMLLDGDLICGRCGGRRFFMDDRNEGYVRSERVAGRALVRSAWKRP